nr:immunoglobulin light chain junction region [Macaca mulatta]
CQQYNKSPYSF